MKPRPNDPECLSKLHLERSVKVLRTQYGLNPYLRKPARCLDCQREFDALYEETKSFHKRVEFLCYPCRNA